MLSFTPAAPPALQGPTHTSSVQAAWLNIGLHVSDLLGLFLGAHVANLARFGSNWLNSAYFGATLLGILVCGVTFPVFGVYQQLTGKLWARILRAAAAWSAACGGLVVLAYLLKIDERYDRGWVLVWFGSSLLVLAFNRVMLRGIVDQLRRRGTHTSHCLIIGMTAAGERLVRTVHEQGISLDFGGYLQTHYDRPPAANITLPCLGNLNDLKAVLEQRAWDQIWIALPLQAKHELNYVLEVTHDSPIMIHYLPDLTDFELLNQRIEIFEGIPTITLRAHLLDGYAWIYKALSDRLLALLILLLISPLMLLIALAIKLSSPGPVFFRQQRHGYAGKVFGMWKFRSMRVHQEHTGHVTQAKRGDARITPLGHLLRRSSLDELPQLFNVLAGDMSLVGPRPHAIEHNQYYKDKVQKYMQRHHMKPGITGWAQVHGLRGETDTLDKMARRVELDLYYIMNWSIPLDIRILIMTLYKGFVHANAV